MEILFPEQQTAVRVPMRVIPVLPVDFMIRFPIGRLLMTSFFLFFRVMLIFLSMVVLSAAMVPIVMTTASLRISGVQVQKINFDNIFLGIHLIK